MDKRNQGRDERKPPKIPPSKRREVDDAIEIQAFSSRSAPQWTLFSGYSQFGPDGSPFSSPACSRPSSPGLQPIVHQSLSWSGGSHGSDGDDEAESSRTDGSPMGLTPVPMDISETDEPQDAPVPKREETGIAARNTSDSTGSDFYSASEDMETDQSDFGIAKKKELLNEPRTKSQPRVLDSPMKKRCRSPHICQSESKRTKRDTSPVIAVSPVPPAPKSNLVKYVENWLSKIVSSVLRRKKKRRSRATSSAIGSTGQGKIIKRNPRPQHIQRMCCPHLAQRKVYHGPRPGPSDIKEDDISYWQKFQKLRESAQSPSSTVSKPDSNYIKPKPLMSTTKGKLTPGIPLKGVQAKKAHNYVTNPIVAFEESLSLNVPGSLDPIDEEELVEVPIITRDDETDEELLAIHFAREAVKEAEKKKEHDSDSS